MALFPPPFCLTDIFSSYYAWMERMQNMLWYYENMIMITITNRALITYNYDYDHGNFFHFSYTTGLQCLLLTVPPFVLFDQVT